MNRFVDISRKKQISPTAAFHNLIQSWLRNGKVIGIPRIDTGFIDIDNRDNDIWIFCRNYCTCRTS